MGPTIKSWRDVRRVLTALGFVLVRHKKHEVWKKGAQIVIVPRSPSCHHALRNFEARLRRDGILPRKGT